MGGRDRITKADHSGLVSGGFQKQDYLRDLSWATIVDFSTYPPNLKIYMTSPNLIQLPTQGALTGFHHVPGIDGFSTLLSQGCVLGLAQRGGKWSTHSKNRGGSGAFVQLVGPTSCHIFSMTFPNNGTLSHL